MKVLSFFGKCICFALAAVLILSFGSSSFAAAHNIEELHFTIDLPDTWTVCTRTEYNADFVKAWRGIETDEDWQSFMKAYEFYMYATVPANEGQYEIYVASYDDFNEEIDYIDCHDFELKGMAKASFKANNENNDVNTYSSYDVVNGENTKYIVFDYTGTDESGNKTYGRLYHTVMNGFAIDFDMSSYDKNFENNEFLKVFDDAVKGVSYESVPVAEGKWYELSPRTKTNLSYAALLVLAIALVVVIVVFIISKAKEKKQFNAAAEEAIRAAQESEKEPEVFAPDEDTAEAEETVTETEGTDNDAE